MGLHGSSTQAGRKWPCAKREVAVVKQEGGAGLWQGVGRSPAEWWMGGRRVVLGRGGGSRKRLPLAGAPAGAECLGMQSQGLFLSLWTKAVALSLQG